MNDATDVYAGEDIKARKMSAPDPLLNRQETKPEREPQSPATPESIRKQIAIRRQSLNRDKSILELLRDRGLGSNEGDDEDEDEDYGANTESSYDASNSFEAPQTPPHTSCLPCFRLWPLKYYYASSESYGPKSGAKASVVESAFGEASVLDKGDAPAEDSDANTSTPTGWEAAKRATHSVNFVQKLKSGKQTDAHARLRGYLAFVPAMLIRQLDAVAATTAATAVATRATAESEHGPHGSSNNVSMKSLLRGSMAVSPSLERRQGVVFFADLSGFTKLTEKLAVHPHGAELLCAALDQVYALLLGAANQWGGDAVKFAGDAILFCWSVSDDDDETDRNIDLRQCCERAIRCSDLVHQLIKAHPPVAGVQLTLHAGLCVGPLACCVLGGATLQPRRFEFVVCGPPLAQLAVAEPAAKPGETVLSPEAAALVAGSGLCRLEAIQSPDPAAGYFRLKGMTLVLLAK
jgi:class 3 adenylate cyclase